MQCRVGLIAVLALVTVGISPGNAVADPQPPPNTSGIAQYVESLPTSSGAIAINPRSTPRAPTLREIATSPAYGAPQTSVIAPKRRARKSAQPERPRAKAPVVKFAVPPPGHRLRAAAQTVGLTAGDVVLATVLFVPLMAFVAVRLAIRERRPLPGQRALR